MTNNQQDDIPVVDDDEERRGWPNWAYALLALAAVLLIVLGLTQQSNIARFLGFGQEATTEQVATEQVAPKPMSREETYTVKLRNTLYGVFGKENGDKVCVHNKLVDCDDLKVGQVLRLQAGVKPITAKVVKATPAKPAKAMSAAVLASTSLVRRLSGRDTEGWWQWWNVGGSPMLRCAQDEPVETYMAGINLSNSDKEELRHKIASGDYEAVAVPVGTRYKSMTFCKNGKMHIEERVVLVDPDTLVTAKRYSLSSGRIIDDPEQCENWAELDVPPLVQSTPPEVPTLTTPPQEEVRYQVPVMEERMMAEETVSAAAIEYEAIAGVWVGRSGLANFRGAYAEGLIKLPVGDGWTVGAGAMGMIGAGESRVSDYSWDEWRYGPQVALYNDRLVTRTITDEFGQEHAVSMPVHDGIKLRYLFDGVRGGNPTSGYQMEQKGHGIGIYAEHVERTSPTQMWGVTGEAFIQTDASIVSTWAGDSPQNRSMYAVTGFGQTVLDDEYHWQLRYGAGLTHQAWDKVNYLSLFAELRYDETIMCGPRLSLALNRPESYKPYTRGDLTTLMAFCRIELGGKIRAWDKNRREERVELVQTGWRPLEAGELVPEGAQVVEEMPTTATETTESDLLAIDLTGIGEPADDNEAVSTATAIGQ